MTDIANMTLTELASYYSGLSVEEKAVAQAEIETLFEDASTTSSSGVTSLSNATVSGNTVVADGTTADGQKVTCTYSATTGRLLSTTTEAGVTTNYEYDWAGRIKSTTTVNSDGTITVVTQNYNSSTGYVSSITTAVYDENNELIAKQQAKYDSKDGENFTLKSITNTTVTNGVKSASTQNYKGTTLSASDIGVMTTPQSYTISYDVETEKADTQIYDEAEITNVTSDEKVEETNEDGEVTTVTYVVKGTDSSGNAIENTYNSSGLLTEQKIGDDLVITYTYNSSGNVTSQIVSDGDGNILYKTTQGYKNGWISSVETKTYNSDGTWQTETYFYSHSGTDYTLLRHSTTTYQNGKTSAYSSTYNTVVDSSYLNSITTPEKHDVEIEEEYTEEEEEATEEAEE